jgi:ADP-heptose:LPS heptosyltransferase
MNGEQKEFYFNIQWLFRHYVAYPFLRLLFHNPHRSLPLRLSDVKKLLILRYDRIGDMIVTTPIVRKLKQARPGITIGIMASEKNAPIIKANPNVDHVYVVYKNWIKLFLEILRARKEGYDVVLNFIFNRTTSGGLLANLIAPNGIKVGQGAEKYRFYFNSLLSLQRAQTHMARILADFMEEVFALSVSEEELSLEIVCDESAKESANTFCERNVLSQRSGNTKGKMPYVILNISAAGKERLLSMPQIEAILMRLKKRNDVTLVMIYAPTEAHVISELRVRLGPNMPLVFPEHGAARLTELAAFIGGAACIITPDTAIIHFASAMQTPVLGFYATRASATEWGPYHVKHKIVIAEVEESASTIPEQVMADESTNFVQEILNTRQTTS